MNPIKLTYLLKMRGYTLAKVGLEVGVSRQVVWETIFNNRHGSKSLLVHKKIGEILTN